MEKIESGKISFFCTSAKIKEDNPFYINAFKTWKKLGIDMTLFGNMSSDFETLLRKYHITLLQEPHNNTSKLPTLDALFDLIYKYAKTEYICFMNADIMISPNFINTFDYLYTQFSDFFMIGQRWDWTEVTPINIDDDWDVIMNTSHKKGSMHLKCGIDYFLLKRKHLKTLNIPKFYKGRTSYDLWLVGCARTNHIPLIDTTITNSVIHLEPGIVQRQSGSANETYISEVNHNSLLLQKSVASGDISSAEFKTLYDTKGNIRYVRI